MAVEHGVEAALNGKGVLRKGKAGVGVQDVTYEGTGVWGRGDE